MLHILDGIQSFIVPLFLRMYTVLQKSNTLHMYKQLCCVFSTINNKKIGLCYLEYEKISYDSE